MNLSDKKSYVIDQLGDDYLNGGSTEIRYQCPFCKEQGRTYEDYKLYVNYSKMVYWCHRCEATGHIHVDELLADGSSTDVYGFLSQYLDNLSDNKSDEQEDSDYYIIPKNSPMPGTLAWDYLINRGITPGDISYYNIRVPGLNDPKVFHGRIVIPNQVISNVWCDLYVARTFIDHEIRYKNPSSSKSHDIVFNLHRIEDNPDRIIINEGAINSIIAGRDSVATFGKYVSDKQLLQILNKHPKKIYVSQDADAKKQAVELCERILQLSDCEIYLVELPEVYDPINQKMKGLDASDLGKSRYLEYIDNAIPFNGRSTFMISNYIRRLESN